MPERAAGICRGGSNLQMATRGARQLSSLAKSLHRKAALSLRLRKQAGQSASRKGTGRSAAAGLRPFMGGGSEAYHDAASHLPDGPKTFQDFA